MSQQKNNHFSRKIIAVLEIIATFARDYQINPIGEVLEWLKRHAWKACSRQNRLAGSNPVLSARKKSCKFCRTFFVRIILTIVLNSAISRQAKANKFSLVFWLNEIVGFRRSFWKNVANYALFSCLVWLFDINLASLPHNLRHYKCYFVAQSTNALCIYTKETIGRTSVGTPPRYHSFRRKYFVSRGCFMAG